MMIRKEMISVCLIAIVLAGCSVRRRSNPLDPLNSVTEGKVQGVKVVSEKHNVKVEWYPVNLESVSSYRIYKRRGASGNFIITGEVTSDKHVFTDFGCEYDSVYSYSVTACTENYESPFSDTVSITPGPLCFWLADRYGGLVARLSYDIQKRFFWSTYLPSPVGIAADSITSTAWVIDHTGYIAHFSKEGYLLSMKSGLDHPCQIICNPLSGIIWVVDENSTNLSCFDTSASLIKRFNNFKGISSIDWSESPRGCWVADAFMKKIFFVSDSGTVDTLTIDYSLSSPAAVAYFRKGRWLWVGDSNKLLKVYADGSVDTVCEFPASIKLITCDQKTGACCVATGSSGDYTLINISREGTVLWTTEGFIEITSIVADSHSGGVVVADPAKGTVFHISGRGEIINELKFFSGPWALSAE